MVIRFFYFIILLNWQALLLAVGPEDLYTNDQPAPVAELPQEVPFVEFIVMKTLCPLTVDQYASPQEAAHMVAEALQFFPFIKVDQLNLSASAPAHLAAQFETIKQLIQKELMGEIDKPDLLVAENSLEVMDEVTPILQEVQATVSETNNEDNQATYELSEQKENNNEPELLVAKNFLEVAELLPPVVQEVQAEVFKPDDQVSLEAIEQRDNNDETNPLITIHDPGSPTPPGGEDFFATLSASLPITGIFAATPVRQDHLLKLKEVPYLQETAIYPQRDALKNPLNPRDIVKKQTINLLNSMVTKIINMKFPVAIEQTLHYQPVTLIKSPSVFETSMSGRSRFTPKAPENKEPTQSIEEDLKSYSNVLFINIKLGKLKNLPQHYIEFMLLFTLLFILTKFFGKLFGSSPQPFGKRRTAW